MDIFASHFWLWSIVALVALVLLWTLGSLFNMVGFVTPIKRAREWLDDLPTPVQGGLVVLVCGLVVYPWFIHRLWAEANADQIRRAFDSVPRLPGARADAPVEQMGGLFDPTGTEGTYIIGTYGTSGDFESVRGFYEKALAERSWVPQSSSTQEQRPSAAPGRLEFRDHADPTRSQYEIVIVQLPAGSQEVSAQLKAEPILFSVRLGIVDPRATTQVAWFIDCLVRRAPTFPTCEPMGWNPVEGALVP